VAGGWWMVALALALGAGGGAGGRGGTGAGLAGWAKKLGVLPLRRG
jgi:hypothetical protein